MTLPRRAIAAVVSLVAAACGGGVPPRLDLGTVTVEQETGVAGAALARVDVANVGGGALLLDGVRLDCGCRLVSSVPETLAGGERVVIVVRCRRAGAAAAASHEIRIASNDPQQAEAVARFAAAGEERPGVEPRALYFGYVAVGGSATRELTLDAVASLGAPVASDPELQVEPRPPRPDGRHVVRVRFTPRASGVFHGALAFDGRPAIPASGVGYRDVLAFPAELTLPSEVSPGAAPAIALKHVGAAALDVAAVEAPPGVVAELQTTTPGREFRVVLRAHGRLAADAAIRLHTNDADEPLVTIPLREVGG